MSVISEMDAVCVNAMRSPHCMLHPARLYVMVMCVQLIATHCTEELLDGYITGTTLCE